MKKIKYLFLLTLLIGALVSTAKADGNEDSLRMGFGIAAPPPVCEGGFVDITHCLDTVSFINDTAQFLWYISRPSKTNPAAAPTLLDIHTTPVLPGDKMCVNIRNWKPIAQEWGAYHMSDTVTITVYPKSRETITVDACDSYRWTIDSVLYSESGTYTHISPHADSNGCDIINTLNLTINHGVYDTTIVMDCDSYTWGEDSTTYTTSGLYSISYNDSIHNCPSVKTLILTINRSTYRDFDITACNSYTWNNGITYTASTEDTIMDTNQFGCDSINRLHVTINYSSHNDTTVVACDSYQWNWSQGAETYIQSGNYGHGYMNNENCYSTDTLHLTINNSTTSSDTMNICDSYTWHGTTYSMGGSYTFDTTNSDGCSHRITLSLNIRRSTSSSITATACDDYPWHGTNYTADTTATFDTVNAVECDSLTTLHLTVNYSNTGIETITACDSYLWHGTIYDASTTTPTFTCNNVAGCDSVTTLHLTINNSDTVADVATACEEYTWYDRHYIYSGDYRFDTLNSDGCHRLMTLNLTVNYGTHNVVTLDSCEQCTWHGTVYTADGTYTWDYQNQYDCPSVDTLHLIIYGARIPESRELVLKNLGTGSPQMIIYPRKQGEKDYAYDWYRDGNPIEDAHKQYYRLRAEDQGLHTFAVYVSPIEQKRCFSVSDTLISVYPQTQEFLNVSPNPNNGVFTLTVTGQEEAVEAAFYNVYGTLVAILPATDNMVKVGGELPQGVYMVNVTTRKGEVYATKVVVK